MRLVIISDTHSYHRRISVPDGDILIHCGDQTFRGELTIWQDVCQWAKEQPHKEKIFIAGNHEVGMQYSNKRNTMLQIMADTGIHYLQDSSVEIDGIHFYGSAFSPEFCGWEFSYRRGKEAARKWKNIPDRTNILLTHGPPMGFHDLVARGENIGCKDLLERIEHLAQLGNLRAHAYGHNHRDANEPPIEKYGVKFCNASICNNAYNPINKPVVIDI